MGEENEIKTLRVKRPTHERLSALGEYGETMDDIINKLIDKVEKVKK